MRNSVGQDKKPSRYNYREEKASYRSLYYAYGMVYHTDFRRNPIASNLLLTEVTILEPTSLEAPVCPPAYRTQCGIGNT